MKNFLNLILMFFMVSSLLFPLFPQFPWTGPDDFTGVFVLQEDFTMRVSIESGWERGGRIPVVLSFGDLEVSLWMKGGNLATAAAVETGISEMLSGDINLPLFVYEQNPVRTRMRLSDENMPIILKLNRQKKQAAFYIGNSRLKLNCIRVTFTEIVPGELYELTFYGFDVYTYKRFIFKPPIGAIYAVPIHHRAAVAFEPEFDEKNVWAVMIDIEREKGKLLNQGEIK